MSGEQLFVQGVDAARIAEVWPEVAPRGSAQALAMSNNPWLVLRNVRGQALAGLAQLLSARLGCDVVAFAHEPQCDAFELQLFQAGQLVRHLDYEGGSDDGWRTVAGHPQSFEPIFFDDDDLQADFAAWADDDEGDPAQVARSRQAVQTRTLVQGSWWPYVGRLDILSVIQAMGLPGAAGDAGFGDPVQLGTPPAAGWRRLLALIPGFA